MPTLHHHGQYWKLETGEFTVFPPDPETPAVSLYGTLTRTPSTPWVQPLLVVCWTKDCNKVKNDLGIWVDASTHKDDLARTHRLSHGICPRCFEHAKQNL